MSWVAYLKKKVEMHELIKRWADDSEVLLLDNGSVVKVVKRVPHIRTYDLLVFGAGFVAVGLLWLYYLAFPESGRERRDSSTVSTRKMRFKEAMTNCLASSTNFGIPVSSGRFHAWKGPKTFEAFERLKTKKSYPSESFHPFFNANGWLDIGFGTRMF